MKKYIYYSYKYHPVIDGELDLFLNKKGDEGWDLCGCITLKIAGLENYTAKFIFKKEV